MDQLSSMILTRIYAGLLARSMVAKFAKGMLLSSDQQDAALERLTEKLADKTPLDNTDLGIYARRLASHAVMESVDNPESLQSFARVREQFLDKASENALGAYVWAFVSSTAAALKALEPLREAAYDVLSACREIAETQGPNNRFPVKTISFSWGPLGNAVFAQQALGQLVSATTFADPTVFNIQTVLRAEITAFGKYLTENRAALNALYEAQDAPNPIVSLAQNVAQLDSYIESFPVGSFPDTANTAAIIMRALEYKAELEGRDASAEDGETERDTFLAKLIRYIVLLSGALQYQRQTLFANTVVLAIDTSNPELPLVVINPDQGGFMNDPVQRKGILQGIREFAKTGMTLPNVGMTTAFVEKSLPFYTERASYAVEAASVSEDNNYLSQAKAQILPLLKAYLVEMNAKMSNPRDIGNLDAIAEIAFGKMVQPTNVGRSDNPADYLVAAVAKMANVPFIDTMVSAWTSSNGPYTEISVDVFSDSLVADFYS